MAFKRIILSFVLFSLALFVSGCAKSDYKITVNRNNTVKISQSHSIDTSFIENENIKENLDEMLSQAQIKLIQKGYKTQTFQENNFQGITASKEYARLKYVDDTELPIGFITSEKLPINLKKGALKNKYTIYMIYSKKKAKKEAKKLFNTTFEVADNNASDAKLTIKIPSKAKENNADFVSKKEYTWDLNNDTPTTIKLVWEKYNPLSLFLMIFSIMAMIFIIVYSFATKGPENELCKRERL